MSGSETQPRFAPLSPRSGKLMCTIDGASGYWGGSWMDLHRGPHDIACRCGRRYPSLSGLAGHLRARGNDGPEHGRVAQAACEVPNCGRPGFGRAGMNDLVVCDEHWADYLGWKREVDERQAS